MAFIRENYSKYEYRVAMRDGIKLFTTVYVPKDVAGEGRTYPILLEQRLTQLRRMVKMNFPPTWGPLRCFRTRNSYSLTRMRVGAT